MSENKCLHDTDSGCSAPEKYTNDKCPECRHDSMSVYNFLLQLNKLIVCAVSCDCKNGGDIKVKLTNIFIKVKQQLTAAQSAVSAMEKIIKNKADFRNRQFNTDCYCGRIDDIIKDYESAQSKQKEGK